MTPVTIYTGRVYTVLVAVSPDIVISEGGDVCAEVSTHAGVYYFDFCVPPHWGIETTRACVTRSFSR